MAKVFLPEIGCWYEGADGQFKVVALDDADLAIEIQYFDGTLSELDVEAWFTAVMTPIAAPEDWSGPFDDLERGDLDEGDFAVNHISHQGVLEELDWFK